MTFQREMTVGLHPRAKTGGEWRGPRDWIGDALAMLSILGLIPLGMAMLSIWLDIG